MMSSKLEFPCAVEQSADGARQLVATRDVEPGELLRIEVPTVRGSGIADPSQRAWDIVRQLLSQEEILSWFLQIGFKLTTQALYPEDEQRLCEIVKDFGIGRGAARDLFFRVATNHLGYFDAHGAPAGFGLYETLCFSNHSCAPNSAPRQPM